MRVFLANMTAVRQPLEGRNNLSARTDDAPYQTDYHRGLLFLFVKPVPIPAHLSYVYFLPYINRNILSNIKVISSYINYCICI